MNPYIKKFRRPTPALSGIHRLFILFCLFLALTSFCSLRQDQRVEPLAQKVLRFRVLAASNSPEDQAVKLQVRDAILQWIASELPATTSAAETALLLETHLEELTEVARRAAVFPEPIGSTPASSAPAPDVEITLGDCYFPEKTYGELTFPQGTYRALRVSIGEAAGKNWWCMLYPALCFTDAVTAEVPEESVQILKNVLTEEEYEQLNPDTSQVEFRFWLWDWLQSLWKGE